jgi:hypothetical protein
MFYSTNYRTVKELIHWSNLGPMYKIDLELSCGIILIQAYRVSL